MNKQSLAGFKKRNKVRDILSSATYLAEIDNYEDLFFISYGLDNQSLNYMVYRGDNLLCDTSNIEEAKKMFAFIKSKIKSLDKRSSKS